MATLSLTLALLEEPPAKLTKPTELTESSTFDKSTDRKLTVPSSLDAEGGGHAEGEGGGRGEGATPLPPRVDDAVKLTASSTLDAEVVREKLAVAERRLRRLLGQVATPPTPTPCLSCSLALPFSLSRSLAFGKTEIRNLKDEIRNT